MLRPQAGGTRLCGDDPRYQWRRDRFPAILADSITGSTFSHNQRHVFSPACGYIGQHHKAAGRRAPGMSHKVNLDISDFPSCKNSAPQHLSGADDA